MKNPVVGITGIMASGKSSLCKSLAELGFRVISADELVQALYQKGSKGAQILAKLDIRDIINNDGSVNKPKLRELMFVDKAFRKKVEKAIHPVIIKEIQELIAQDETKPIAVEIPLLFEAELDNLCSYTVTVFRKRSHSIEAVKEKYKIALAEAENMLNAQLDMTEKMIRADFTVMNDASIAELNKKAESLKRSILTLWKK